MSEIRLPFERMGGRPGIAALVARFYALMDSEPTYAQLRAMHGPDLTPMVASLTDFLVGWLGGPRDWFDQRPGACIMSAHAAMPGMNKAVAAQWMDAMQRAGAETLVDDWEMRAVMMEAMERMGRNMAARAAAERADTD